MIQFLISDKLLTHNHAGKKQSSITLGQRSTAYSGWDHPCSLGQFKEGSGKVALSYSGSISQGARISFADVVVPCTIHGILKLICHEIKPIDLIKFGDSPF